MNNNRFVALIGLVLAISALAWWLHDRDQARYQEEPAGAAVPGLVEQLASVDRVTIQPAGEESWTLARGDGGWQMVEAEGFPANVGVLSRELRKLASAERVEAKTRNPAYYEKLGVQAIEEASSPTLRVIAHQGENTVADILIGQVGQGGNYLRLSNEEQSWLTDSSFAFPRSKADYLERQITSLPRTRFFSIEVDPREGPSYRLSRTTPEQQDFDLTPPPRDAELNYANINRLGAALSNLRLNMVRKAQEDVDLSDWNTATFRSFDGLVVTLWSLKGEEGDGQVRLEARYEAPPLSANADQESGAGPEAEDSTKEDPAIVEQRVRKEVEAINARTAGWTFKVSSYNADALAFGYDSLLKNED